MSYRKDDQYRNYSKRGKKDYEYRGRKHAVEGSRPSHVSVVPKDNEPIERTIKKFLRKIKKSGIADEYRKRRFFEKPSTKKRRRRMRRATVLKRLLEKEGK